MQLTQHKIHVQTTVDTAWNTELDLHGKVSKFHCRPIAVKCDNFGIEDIDISCSCVRCTAAVYLTYEATAVRRCDISGPIIELYSLLCAEPIIELYS